MNKKKLYRSLKTPAPKFYELAVKKLAAKNPESSNCNNPKYVFFLPFDGVLFDYNREEFRDHGVFVFTRNEKQAQTFFDQYFNQGWLWRAKSFVFYEEVEKEILALEKDSK